MSLHDIEGDEDDPREGSVQGLLADILVRDAVPPRFLRRLARRESVALVLAVPGPDWVAPVQAAIASAWPDAVVFARDGSSRSEHKPSVGNSLVSAALTRAQSVLGVSQNPRLWLPEALVSCADAQLVVSPPSGEQLRRAMRRAAVARVPRLLPVAPADCLTFNELAAAFRPGATGREILASLARVAASKTRATAADSTPPIAELPGCPAEARAWGLCLADGIEAWRRGEARWSDLPAAAVLTGPPGTGKTTIAKAVARGCGLAFVPTSVGEWFSRTDGHLGDVAKALQLAWDRALAARPALFFCDELDALPNRDRLTDRAREWWTPIVTLALNIFDGATTDREGVVLLGATNHGDLLDPALTRAGRLEQTIFVPLPDSGALAEVLAHHLGGALDAAALLPIVRQAIGATPADAARWAGTAREAARIAGRELTMADVEAAVLPADGRSLSELLRAARHEAAHAVVGLRLGAQNLEYVSLNAPGADGVASFSRKPERASTRTHLEAMVVTGLAGRAADELFGAADARAGGGPGSDLYNASALLAMVHRVFGLGDTLLSLGAPNEAVALLRADAALRELVDGDLFRLYARAQAMVADRRLQIEMLARALVRRRFLSAAEVRGVLARVGRADAMRLSRRRRRK